MIPDHLRIRPGQQALTPEQEAEARRFAAERIEVQLSTKPVDEQKAEAFLWQAYAVAEGLLPRHIHWVDGPLELVAALALQDMQHGIWWNDDRVSIHTQWDIEQRVAEGLRHDMCGMIRDNVMHGVRDNVGDVVRQIMEESVYERVYASVWEQVPDSKRKSLETNLEKSMRQSVRASAQAYLKAGDLAYCRFLDTYLEPNDVHALARFNERVSGYWLGKQEALVVRRPKVLIRDAEGRLHSETGKCMEYPDGWGFYAWHGVRAPKRVILRPETLTREDFLNEENVEVRRVIQERMGERFVHELGGVVLDRGTRGALYEVALPDDPEQVARYVQVQDASTERCYMLRVPPTIQTATEAVAWTFQVGVEDYHPAQET